MNLLPGMSQGPKHIFLKKDSRGSLGKAYKDAWLHITCRQTLKGDSGKSTPM